MALTAADLTAYIGAPAEDDAFVASCFAEATKLVTDYVAGATVPAEVLEGEIREVGSRLYARRAAPMGVSQFITPEGNAVRIARDPLEGSYPILRRYVGLGIG